MVWHLVLMKPRADLGSDEAAKLIDAFRGAIRDIPSVREVRVARRICHGAGYEDRMPDSADYLVSLGFEDVEGLQRYLTHPAHAELGQRFNQSLSGALIYDFAAITIDDLQHAARQAAGPAGATGPEAS